MRKNYHLILAVLTVILLIFMCVFKLNSWAYWFDMGDFTPIGEAICNVGPILLLCCFAFGGLISKFLIIIIAILLVIFAVCFFAPQWIGSIFGAGTSIIGLWLGF